MVPRPPQVASALQRPALRLVGSQRFPAVRSDPKFGGEGTVKGHLARVTGDALLSTCLAPMLLVALCFRWQTDSAKQPSWRAGLVAT